MVRIYTRTGDGGDTSLGDGSRIPKSGPRVALYGEVDELNSWLGLLRRGPEGSGGFGARHFRPGRFSTHPEPLVRPGGGPGQSCPLGRIGRPAGQRTSPSAPRTWKA